MSTLNIQKALQLMKKEIEKDWKDLEFEYTSRKDEVQAIAKNIKINNHDDDVQVIITAYSGGGAEFRAVFDKIEKTTDILNLLNDFNHNNIFFKAFIRDDGFLELEHFFICFEEAMFKSYSGEFLSRLAGLSSNEYLQELTKYTHD